MVSVAEIVAALPSQKAAGGLPSEQFSKAIHGIPQAMGNVSLHLLNQDAGIFHRAYGSATDENDFILVTCDQNSGKYGFQHRILAGQTTEILESNDQMDLQSFRENVIPLVLELNFRGTDSRLSRAVEIDGVVYNSAGTDGEEHTWIGAAMNCDSATIQTLVREGFDVNFQNKDGLTALHMACAHNCVEVVRVLIANGANVNARTDGNTVPLHHLGSSSKSGAELAHILVTAGADLEATDKSLSRPLMNAAFSGDIPTIKTFAELGAQINARDRRGWTALDHGIMSGWTCDAAEVVRELTKLGAEVNIADNDGETPLMMAVLQERSGNIIEALIEGGAQVNTRTPKGVTALMMAANKGDEEAVEALLSAGADPKLTLPGRGLTAADAAVDGGHARVAAIIRTYKPTSSSSSQSSSPNKRMALIAVAGLLFLLTFISLS